MRCAVGGAFWTGCQKQILNMPSRERAAGSYHVFLHVQILTSTLLACRFFIEAGNALKGQAQEFIWINSCGLTPRRRTEKAAPDVEAARRLRVRQQKTCSAIMPCAVGGAFWTGCQKQILKMPSRERTAGSYHVFLHVQIRTSTLLACSFLKKEGNAWKRQAQEFVWIKSCGLTPRRRMRDN